MSIDANVVASQPVARLRTMFVAEYAPQGGASIDRALPAILNALGACAGFAAQVAVWRELILPNRRNPGEFLVYVTTQSGGRFFFGEAINLFLFSVSPERVSFLSFAASELKSSELPDIGELLTHVTKSVGTDAFGRPRALPSIELPDLPRDALARFWGKAAQILEGCRPAEWPALLGAVAQSIVGGNRGSTAPLVAVKIMLEAAVPMSKLDPATVVGSGVPAPSFANWSMRALQPEHNQSIVTEVRAVMPPFPAGIATKPLVIDQPKIVFLNLAGAACEAIAEEDRTAIGESFQPNVRMATSLVTCDVLFLYCTLDRLGKVVGQPRSLRDLIRDTDAQVAVIASEVPADFMRDPEFSTALSKGDNPPVNLVITFNRHGEAFGRFFRSLFQLMWTGHSMPMAWVQLAPQGPAQPTRDDGPGTIFLAERGQVAFAPKLSSGQRSRLSMLAQTWLDGIRNWLPVRR